ncbi:hypothetical protein BKA61DRAFT_568327 [Leptodontidium sp. MPI-SDFR-AT-0119]|nr:hypothetical protein BKA61DRAFT_568327 [Leptodontidium sp. MPI-SDFR-AT-0119]
MRLWGEKSRRSGGNVPRSDGFEGLAKLLDLPLEIKFMIFKYSLPPPRSVTVYEPSNGPRLILKIDPETRANAVPTPLLHTCRESREFALKTFQRFDVPSNFPFCFRFKENTLRVSHDWALKTLYGYQPWHREVTDREVPAWQRMIRNLSLVGSTSQLDFQWVKNMKALEVFYWYGALQFFIEDGIKYLNGIKGYWAFRGPLPWRLGPGASTKHPRRLEVLSGSNAGP